MTKHWLLESFFFFLQETPSVGNISADLLAFALYRTQIQSVQNVENLSLDEHGRKPKYMFSDVKLVFCSAASFSAPSEEKFITFSFKKVPRFSFNGLIFCPFLRR